MIAIRVYTQSTEFLTKYHGDRLEPIMDVVDEKETLYTAN